VSDDPNVADVGSATPLLTIDQPAGLTNHKGRNPFRDSFDRALGTLFIGDGPARADEGIVRRNGIIARGIDGEVLVRTALPESIAFVQSSSQASCSRCGNDDVAPCSPVGALMCERPAAEPISFRHCKVRLNRCPLGYSGPGGGKGSECCGLVSATARNSSGADFQSNGSCGSSWTQGVVNNWPSAFRISKTMPGRIIS
jgi:hypothetical protein